MFYLKNTKPIKLRFYTANASAFEYFKPDHASTFMPKWVSDVSETTRHCYALRSTFKDGFCIPLRSDMSIVTTRLGNGEYQGNFEFPDGSNSLEFLGDGGNMTPKSKMCFRITSPWLVQCDEDIHFVQMENMWTNINRDAEFLSGTLEFKHQHQTNMFFYINSKEQQFLLSAGDTPVIFKQLSERKIKIETFYDPEKTSYLEKKARRISFTHDHMKRRNMGKNKHGHT